MKTVYVIVPFLGNTGLLKGAYAIANGLLEQYDVNLVIVKKKKEKCFIAPGVKVHRLKSGSLIGKILEYQRILKDSSSYPVSISLGFSADFINWFCKRNACIITSVRGNFSKNYYDMYGYPGIALAWFHTFLLRKFYIVIAISRTMEKQLKCLGLKNTSMIGNFIDEKNIEISSSESKYEKDAPIHFIFLGALNRWKYPDLFINALIKLRDCYKKKVIASVIGEGNERSKLENIVKQKNASEYIKFYGHLINPYPVLTKGHFLVLPSKTEGIPRSILEGLYLGLFCITRNVDGNSEIIAEGVNGYLFKEDGELLIAMLKAISLFPDLVEKEKGSLIPPLFRQEHNIKKIIKLIESG